MKTRADTMPGSRARQRGAAAVEFALVCMVFLTLLIGIMEMGRLLFYWNAAAEATRWGPRRAVGCDPNDGIIQMLGGDTLTVTRFVRFGLGE